MRVSRLILLAGTTFQASPVLAADALKFGKPPEWVVPQPLPTGESKSPAAPVAILLNDQQIRFEPGRTVSYTELAMKLQTPEGLAAGNLSLPWDPAKDTVTVNKLQIRRGNQVIDVLASQSFTTIRRETNMELATFDGVLTGNIQPEGLQQGDIIDLAVTTEHVDPVLGNHVEGNFMEPAASPIQLSHLHLDWPSTMPLRVQAKGFPISQMEKGGRKVIEVVQRDVEPIVPPKGAPPRFNITRFGEATDFTLWAEAAALMMPLYKKAEIIAPSGPLRDEVDRIRSTTSDPKQRAEKALQLVQDRVRYVALLMGQGGYVPADAETTWSRRFGDCKAKTALLLGILHSLGVEAEPILVQSQVGDAIPERLPLISYFDHVLVQAHVSGKTYFLDGTRTGDPDLDSIDVPNFGWGLPLVSGAKLVAMMPPPLDQPSTDTKVVIDATKGIRAPVVFNVDQTLHGDGAVAFKTALGALTDAQRTEFFNSYWTRSYDFVSPGPTKTTFDAATRTLVLSMAGTGKLDWTTGYFYLPNTTLGFSPSFERPTGPFQTAPVAVAYPRFTHNAISVRLPPGFFGNRPDGAAATTKETLAGVEYRMTTKNIRGPEADMILVDSSERSLVPEISYADALAAAPRLRELSDQQVLTPLPRFYRATEEDLAALLTEKPATASAFVDRGESLVNDYRYAEGIADFNQALKLEPTNKDALADRAMSEVWLRKFDDAEKDLAAVDARDSDHPVALLAHGLLAQFKGDCARAVGFFTRSLSKQPDHALTIGHRAICESSLSKDDDALADSATALRAAPAWMDLRLLRASIFSRRGNSELAAKEAELMTNENPNSAFAHVAAGKIYARLARTKDAMKEFDVALTIKPEAYVYLNRAQSRPFTDRVGRLADLDTALKMDPKNEDALAEKAEQLAIQGDMKAAKEIYDQLVAREGSDQYYKIRRAVLLFKTGAAEDARKQFEQFRSVAKSANDFNSLCWEKATGGILLDLALDECHEALKREPDTAAYLDSLGLVELRLGHLDEAISDYSRAIAKNAGAASYMGRALAYARKGNSALASSDLQQALRLDPDEQTRFAEFGLRFDQSVPAAKKKMTIN